MIINNNQVNLTNIENDLIEIKSMLSALALSGGGGVKSVQRGSTTAAGTITINAVDINKAVVLSVSKGSAGTVGVSGNINMNATSLSYQSYYATSGSGKYSTCDRVSTSSKSLTSTIPAHTGTISGGTTNLTTKEYSAVLTNSTTLTCDGPVEWQVIEYN